MQTSNLKCVFTQVSLETLRQHVPSIFTEEKAETTTVRYQHISTLNVIEGLRGEGFVPVWATQCRSRTEVKRAYTKHMIRFRHVNAINVNGLYPELVLINSHDGLCSYRLMSGIYRLVCSNGLIAGNTYAETKVRHQGDVVGNIIQGSFTVMDQSQKLLETSEKMNQIILDSKEKEIFAEAAHQLKFEDNEEQGLAISPKQLLSARRVEDEYKNDLFTTFNVIQENLMKGGLYGWIRDNNNRPKSTKTRIVTGIDKKTSLNRALWTIAEKMMVLKSS
jgi:hypothetical protein